MFRNQLIVNGDLIADFIQIRNTLGPQHFLNLEDYSIPIFEQQRNFVADRNPPILFQLDDSLTMFRPYLFVRIETQNIVERDFLHLFLLTQCEHKSNYSTMDTRANGVPWVC